MSWQWCSSRIQHVFPRRRHSVCYLRWAWTSLLSIRVVTCSPIFCVPADNAAVVQQRVCGIDFRARWHCSPTRNLDNIIHVIDTVLLCAIILVFEHLWWLVRDSGNGQSGIDTGPPQGEGHVADCISNVFHEVTLYVRFSRREQKYVAVALVLQHLVEKRGEVSCNSILWRPTEDVGDRPFFMRFRR